MRGSVRAIKANEQCLGVEMGEGYVSGSGYETKTMAVSPFEAAAYLFSRERLELFECGFHRRTADRARCAPLRTAPTKAQVLPEEPVEQVAALNGKPAMAFTLVAQLGKS